MIAFVTAIGYGLSYEIAKLLGWEEWLCIVACLVLGVAVEWVVSKIIFSRAIQKKTSYRFMAFAVLILIFLAVQYFVMTWLKLSMLEALAGFWALRSPWPSAGTVCGKSASSTETGATVLYLTKR